MASLLVADLTPARSRPGVATFAWQQYLISPDDELARIDIAAMSLQCAMGLPGAERIDVAGCLRTIDGWVPVVRRWTEAAYREFFLSDPAQFRNSEAFFRCVALVTALQRHCGVRYDPSKAGLGPDDPYDFDEQFVHGVIQGAGGTCATLPVIYASVGRRLGYPIKLACAKRHLFCRWDDPRADERWNIEGTATEEGFSSYPDDHYRSWPDPRRPEKPPGPVRPNRLQRFGGQNPFFRELAPWSTEQPPFWEKPAKYDESITVTVDWQWPANASKPLVWTSVQ